MKKSTLISLIVLSFALHARAVNENASNYSAGTRTPEIGAILPTHPSSNPEVPEMKRSAGGTSHLGRYGFLVLFVLTLSGTFTALHTLVRRAPVGFESSGGLYMTEQPAKKSEPTFAVARRALRAISAGRKEALSVPV